MNIKYPPKFKEALKARLLGELSFVTLALVGIYEHTKGAISTFKNEETRDIKLDKLPLTSYEANVVYDTALIVTSNYAEVKKEFLKKAKYEERNWLSELKRIEQKLNKVNTSVRKIEQTTININIFKDTHAKIVNHIRENGKFFMLNFKKEELDLINSSQDPNEFALKVLNKKIDLLAHRLSNHIKKCFIYLKEFLELEKKAINSMDIDDALNGQVFKDFWETGIWEVGLKWYLKQDELKDDVLYANLLIETSKDSSENDRFARKLLRHRTVTKDRRGRTRVDWGVERGHAWTLGEDAALFLVLALIWSPHAFRTIGGDPSYISPEKKKSLRIQHQPIRNYL